VWGPGCVAGAGAEGVGVWLCRGCGWCLEGAAVSRK
jgi:ribosomal protein L37AE/L43A